MRRCSSSGGWPRAPPPRSGTWMSWDAIITRQLQLARDTGALAQLATALQGKGIVVTWSGDFRRSGLGDRRGRRGHRRDRHPHRLVRRNAARGVPGARSRGLRAARDDDRERHRPAARASPFSSRAGQRQSSSTASAATSEALVAARQASDAAPEALSSPTGRWPSWSRPASVAGTRTSPPRLSSDSSRPRARAAPTGDSGSWRARGRW